MQVVVRESPTLPVNAGAGAELSRSYQHRCCRSVAASRPTTIVPDGAPSDPEVEQEVRRARRKGHRV